jgi:hypothetical protein
MKHLYSEILIAIAEGKEIQFHTVSGDGWVNADTPDVLLEIANEDYDSQRYRVKPSTITINGVECEPPVNGGSYSVSVCGSAWWFATEDARDAAYAALIKPFGEQL